MVAGGHFGCPKITFDLISIHFTSIFFLKFLTMADVGHFGCPNLTFDRISGHFRSIRNFYFFEIFDKMADVVHFGCPQITFDHISGHFRSICNFFFNLFDKMAAGGHFGWVANVNYRISETSIGTISHSPMSIKLSGKLPLFTFPGVWNRWSSIPNGSRMQCVMVSSWRSRHITMFIYII